MNQSRMFVYKIIEDSGGAPCVERNLLSLTLCKPGIRRSAVVGDWIFAFGSNNEDPQNRLVYVARITEKILDGEYYERSAFSSRGDCIYRRQRNGRFVLRPDARFHNDEDVDLRDYDLGEPTGYQSAIALLSNDFRYFGKNGNDDWKGSSPALKRMVESLCQGHRVNHSHRIFHELLSLQKLLWLQHTQCVLGTPLHGESVCSTQTSSRQRIQGRK